MADDLRSARFQFPFLAAGQSQKEMTHNEALALLDAAVAPAAQAAGQNTPPATPTTGQAWLVGAVPTGLWAGHAQHLAIWTAGGWRFVDMPAGAMVAVGGGAQRWVRVASGWRAPALLAAPAGGTTVDTQCRTALNNLVSALVESGIVAV
ncbi:MAG: DUF2793 domain-containing protein [Sphingopyxis sp.]